jgi:hypothetical protein
MTDSVNLLALRETRREIEGDGALINQPLPAEVSEVERKIISFRNRCPFGYYDARLKPPATAGGSDSYLSLFA